MKLDDILAAAKALEERQRFRRLDYFRPYPKQREFLTLSAVMREVMLMAGNQLGKTETGAYAAACHLTGEYPADWKGRKYTRPVRMWIAGETAQLVRDVQQKKLCGSPGVEADFGTGMIPKENFADKPTLARGVSDAYDTIQVKHKSGGVSTATFKSYEQGRPKFQGEPVDIVWCDEEPPMDVYSECLTRTTATKGFVYMTFTPLKGMSDVVMRYMNEPSPDRALVSMTIDDAEHISKEEREKIIAGYLPHEREARARGIPMLGSGRIFQIIEESIIEPIMPYLPPQWVKGWGIDFGIDHPFAAVLAAWDRDNDIIHILHTIKIKGGGPLEHASQMKAVGAAVPVFWPHDGASREKGTTEPLAWRYKEQGLLTHAYHSSFPDGSISTEAAIMEMQERMATGRLKVAAHLVDWLMEFRMYHRKDGLIVKINDDLLSATQKIIMMKRYMRAVALGSRKITRRSNEIADGVDFDLFA